MRLAQWNDAALALARKIGQGRTADVVVPAYGTEPCAVSMECQVLGGAGLVLTLNVGGADLRVWLDELAWCEWLEPMLVVPRLADVPPELLDALLAWTVAPLHAYADLCNVERPVCAAIACEQVEPELACVVVLRRGAAALSLRLLEWPPGWPESLAAGMAPTAGAERAVGERMPFVLAAGYARLTRAQFGTLRSGAAIVLEGDVRISLKEAWIVQARPYARIGQISEGEWKVNDVAPDHMWDSAMGEQSQETPRDVEVEAGDAVQTAVKIAAEAFTFTVVAEIGRIELTLEQLDALVPGMVIEAPSFFDGTVTLRAGGAAIARGRLLQIGDRLAVRLE